MNLLILGGTGFLGPAIVDHALARGWQVTLFNRGRTNPGRFQDLEPIHGDRDPRTARDTAAWFAKAKPDFDFGAKPGAPGLSRAREAELLKSWQERRKD